MFPGCPHRHSTWSWTHLHAREPSASGAQIQYSSMVRAPTRAVSVAMTMIVPAVRRGRHHDGAVGGVNQIRRHNDDRRREINGRRCIHHRRNRGANHGRRAENRQADGDAHPPARPGRTGEREAQTDCQQTDQSFRFHTWWFDGRTAAAFSFGVLIESGEPFPESMGRNRPTSWPSATRHSYRPPSHPE
jgi:hypothetical protein